MPNAQDQWVLTLGRFCILNSATKQLKYLNLFPLANYGHLSRQCTISSSFS